MEEEKNRWFVRYESGKGYIAAREEASGSLEYYGEHSKSVHDCGKIVHALNVGFLKAR